MYLLLSLMLLNNSGFRNLRCFWFFWRIFLGFERLQVAANYLWLLLLHWSDWFLFSGKNNLSVVFVWDKRLEESFMSIQLLHLFD
jgi:hypothetical protein